MHCIMLNTVHCSFEICNHPQHLPMSIGWLVRPSIGNTLRRLNATLTQIWTIFGSERHISPIFQANKANFAIPFLQLARVKFFTFIIYLPRVLNCSPSLFSFSDQLKFWLLPCLPGPWMNFISTSAEIQWSISFTKICSWINLLKAAQMEWKQARKARRCDSYLQIWNCHSLTDWLTHWQVLGDAFASKKWRQHVKGTRVSSDMCCCKYLLLAPQGALGGLAF